MFPLIIVDETYGSNSDGPATTTTKTKTKSKVPRPNNAFILYRKAKGNGIKKHHKDSGQKLPFEKDVSKMVGRMWRNEKAHIHKFYDRLAAEEALGHLHENPGYRYQPLQKKNVRGHLKKTHNELKEKTKVQGGVETITQGISIDTFDGMDIWPNSLPSECLSQDDLQALINSVNFDSLVVDLLINPSTEKGSYRDFIPLDDGFFDFCM